MNPFFFQSGYFITTIKKRLRQVSEVQPPAACPASGGWALDNSTGTPVFQRLLFSSSLFATRCSVREVLGLTLPLTRNCFSEHTQLGPVYLFGVRKFSSSLSQLRKSTSWLRTYSLGAQESVHSVGGASRSMLARTHLK